MILSIIIINYNLSKEVENCINSVLVAAKEVDYEIILIDNHSEDETIIKIAENISRNPNIKKMIFYRTEKNLGFGNACNLAVQKAGGKWLFFLNPDTLIKENIFPKLKEELENNYGGRGILGLNINEGKYVDYSAGLFPNFLFEFLNVVLLGRYFEAFYIKLKEIFSSDKKMKVQWVMGAALLIRKDLYNEINGFDPDYFLYFEEMDMCKRVWDKGLPVTYLSYIKVDHLGSAGSKKNYYFFTKMFYKGKLLFLKKHSTKFTFYIYRLLVILTIMNRIIFWWLFKFQNMNKSTEKIKAFREILKNVSTPEKINNLRA